MLHSIRIRYRAAPRCVEREVPNVSPVALSRSLLHIAASGWPFQMPLNVDALIAKLLAARDSACDRRSNVAWEFSAARAATLAPAGRSSPLPVPCCLQRSRARRSA